jgi:hypothetical protein
LCNKRNAKSPDHVLQGRIFRLLYSSMTTKAEDGEKPHVFVDHEKHSGDAANANVNGVQIPVYSNLELVSSEDLTITAILKGTAARPLNTFEKKAALINAELDAFGLGRYQICIWFLCGFGYFLDLAWAQGVGLISTAIYQEMNVADADTGTIFALANAGLAIGALGFGLSVDIIGRKWAFQLTCLITSVFGLLLVRLDQILSQCTTRELRFLANKSSRPLPNSTTAPSAESTSWPRSVLEATSPSTPPLP